MVHLGRIEGVSESAGIEADKWLALIESHDSLRHVPVKMGINPFTRKACEYKAPPSTAVVLINVNQMGLISWAKDGSQFLNVEAEEHSTEPVDGIAEEVARRLGARFVRETFGK